MKSWWVVWPSCWKRSGTHCTVGVLLFPFLASGEEEWSRTSWNNMFQFNSQSWIAKVCFVEEPLSLCVCVCVCVSVPLLLTQPLSTDLIGPNTAPHSEQVTNTHKMSVRAYQRTTTPTFPQYTRAHTPHTRAHGDQATLWVIILLNVNTLKAFLWMKTRI